MAEWFKAAVLKTVECKSSVGSNPTPSAMTGRKSLDFRYLRDFHLFPFPITVKGVTIESG